MDLSPLYELRDRLKAGAVAGTNLILEDFRLKRAVEAMAPLEAASPVFAKIGQLAQKLLAPDCPDRAGALLDAITLTDAVLCTQGAVAVQGALEPLSLHRAGIALTNAPYSVVAPLIEALTTSGGGRYSLVIDTHKERPELFQDYRVKNALVTALDASFSELAEQVERWLYEEDESILPLLQQDFDPKGKREMVRRVHVIEAIAGGKANDFYLSALETAEKEVRAALLYALRFEESNAGRLVGFCKTEKGACKKAAHWALAKLSSPVAWGYWEAVAAKKPEQAAEYMIYSAAPQAEALVGQALLELLAPYESDPAAPITKETAERLNRLQLSLPGKAGPVICDFYRRAAALEKALDRKLAEEKAGACRFAPYESASETSCVAFSEVIPRALLKSILFRPAPDLLELALELGERYGTRFTVVRLTAALLGRPAAEAYGLASGMLRKKGLFRKGELKEARETVAEALGVLRMDEDTAQPVARYHYLDPALDVTTCHVDHPLYEPLDPGWYDLLMEDGNLDQILAQIIPLRDDALRARLGEYFYKRCLTGKGDPRYVQNLERCGWTKCEGLLKAYCSRQATLSPWSIRNFVAYMPGSPKDRADEIDQVLGMIREGKIKLQGSLGAAGIEELAAELRAKAQAD